MEPEHMSASAAYLERTKNDKEPDFTKIVADRLWIEGQRERSERKEQEVREHERQRRLKLAEQALVSVVSPVLEKVRQALYAGGRFAEIGNGRDPHKSLRLSLRIARAREALVFTACDGSTPYLGWHTEPADMAVSKKPEAIEDPTPGEIARIVADFLTRAIA